MCRRLGGGEGRVLPSHWSEGYVSWPRPLGRGEGKEGCDAPGFQGASILSLRVCACSSLCLRWGHVSARSYVVLCKLSPSVCLPVVKGPGPRQRKGMRMCKLVV